LNSKEANSYRFSGGYYMHGTREIILEATALPVEDRVLIVDSLLRSLNMPDREIEKEWIAVAHRRLEELHSGRVKAIPGDEVFANIRKRFAQ
jgi:putative addiction module component (TIGR02574 family)